MTLRQSESIAKLAPALVKAQAEVENALKNAKNLHLGNEYADIGSVLGVVKPAFSANGLALLQAPGLEGDTVTVEWMLVHESGEWIAGLSGAPLPVGRTNKKGDPIPVTAQDVGSAITYLRRYTAAAVAAITQEDDDGQGSNAGQPEYVSDFQAAQIRERIKKVGADEKKFLAYMKAAEVDYILAARFEDALRALDQKAAQGSGNGQQKAGAAR